MKNLIALFLLALFLSTPIAAQNSSLTKDQVLNMTIDDLSELSLEDLMYAAELLDVQSVDELFAMIMNKNVSSASKKAEDSFATPLSTSVLTREEIRTFGCTSIEEALRLMTGMIVREKTNGNYDVHMRGLDNIPDGNMMLYTQNVNTLVMINGRPSLDYATGSTKWEALPIGIEDIARIEVVRGPSSALYGSNAVSGVINIITETPSADSKTVSGTIQSGSSNTFVGDVAFRKVFSDKLAASISGNYQMRERTTRQIYLVGGQHIFDPNDDTRNFDEGAWVDINEIEKLRVHTANNGTSMLTERSAPIAGNFTDPEVARKSIAVNGAVAYTPTTDINLNFTAGYQQSQAMVSTIGIDYWVLNQMQNKQYYVDLTSNIKGINVQVNYTDGPQNFMMGTPGFKVRAQQLTGNAEYDWQVTDQLTLRPGINYRWNQLDDYDYRWNYDTDRNGEVIKVPSYFEGAATLKALAASLRADYKPLEQLRLIGAYRAEKLNLPDDVYHSWQLAATYSPNENNNLRFIYSRANRSANFTNTSSRYDQMRVDYGFPDEISFKGNKEAKVMIADNLELGYRLRPVQNLLIDAEAYYSWSRDYGALMSNSANMIQATPNLIKLFTNIGGVLQQVQTGALSMADMQNEISKYAQQDVISKAYIRYENLPYKVKQMGLGLSMDWIISSKVIAKMNANVQQTLIDDYYTYSQAVDMTEQFTQTAQGYANAVNEITMLMVNPETREWVTSGAVAQFTHYHHLVPEYEATFDADGNPTQASDDYLKQFWSMEGISKYFALKYGCDMSDDGAQITIGTSHAHGSKVYEKNHKHKHTPSFYGMIGLIYKPTEKVAIAGHGYFYGKQTMKTQFGEEEIDGKFVMNLKTSYRPTEQFEVYFNAHNLFNDSRREYAYTDHTRGIYSIGVTFGF